MPSDAHLRAVVPFAAPSPSSAGLKSPATSARDLVLGADRGLRPSGVLPGKPPLIRRGTRRGTRPLVLFGLYAHERGSSWLTHRSVVVTAGWIVFAGRGGPRRRQHGRSTVCGPCMRTIWPEDPSGTHRVPRHQPRHRGSITRSWSAVVLVAGLMVFSVPRSDSVVGITAAVVQRASSRFFWILTPYWAAALVITHSTYW